MENNEITFIKNDDDIIIKSTNDDDIKPINKVTDNNEDVITLPDWDLVPPFDSIDRGDIK